MKPSVVISCVPKLGDQPSLVYVIETIGEGQPPEHAFANHHRPEVYKEAETELAWSRTLAFLREHVK